MTLDMVDPWLQERYRRPLVMGVVNLTPDSFSDGGSYADAGAAAGHAERLVADGADVLDFGAESTRPGSAGTPADEQVRRLVPVLREVRKRLPSVVISIDTMSGSVAERALDSGANWINDVSAGTADPTTLKVAARHGAPVVLMHMRGTPATMQADPTYSDVTGEVTAYLKDRVLAAIAAGVAPHRVLVDPGIGFGKTTAHNLTLLRDARRIADAVAPHPLVIGTSRKGFIGKVTGEGLESRRLFGTAATVAHSVANGAGVVRVHDVAEMARVVRMAGAISHGGVVPE